MPEVAYQKEPLVLKAIQALGINAPIFCYEIKGKTVTLWLYGRTEPVTFTDRPAKRVTASRKTRGKKTDKS